MRIVVLNPNSTEAVTEGIDKALEPLRLGGGPDIECATPSPRESATSGRGAKVWAYSLAPAS